MRFNGTALAEFARLRMLTRSELAAKAGIVPSYVTELIKGDKKMPSRQVIRRLAEALDIDPRALYVDAPASERGAA